MKRGKSLEFFFIRRRVICFLCVFWLKKVMNFENFEHRSVIKFLTKEGIEPKDIYQRLVNVYRDDAP